MLRAFAIARASPKGAAHLGNTCSNAVDVTNVSSAGSNQITCEGCLPAGRIAARSFSETLTTKASGCAARRRSATVLARSRAAEELAVVLIPSGVTARVASSRRIVNLEPSASSGSSLPTIPDSAGTLPVWSAACPGAVSVTA
jgi:hypothetical protein